ncbi:MAG: hypothetical protein BRC33_03455 [Cyanobacteria bacterium SW_9_44_58]|nr:MAG: hypothetical protein BRC33_03455 [Cyanobacteria bacterium SW_9_44_58]
MSFQLDHHNKILTILESLDSDLLKESEAYFGGGTLLSLDFGEYRLSQDVDFACPMPGPGYKKLRKAIFDYGIKGLFNDESQIKFCGNPINNQYGIRVFVEVNNTLIKIEIYIEARFQLDPPRFPKWSPVACLSISDCFTSKLLCNTDRYMDDSAKGKDLIDLAILRLQHSIPKRAIKKAEQSYEVIRPLIESIQRFQSREEFREKWFDDLQIDSEYLPKIIDGIDLLAKDFELPATERTFREEYDDFYKKNCNSKIETS